MGTFGNDKGGYEKDNVVLDVIKFIGAGIVAICTVIVTILGVLGKFGGGDNKS